MPHAVVAKLEHVTAPTPDAGPILAIHRGADGYVGFVRKPDRPKIGRDGKPVQFETLFSVKVAELREMFPTLVEWLTQDAYFTVNSMYRAAPYLNTLTGLPDVWRKEEHLKYLNAAYTDLDVGRPNSEKEEQRQTWRDAAAVAGKMMDRGELPQASIFARSGQGVYLFWLLRDERNAALPPKGDAKHYPERLALYKSVNRALGERLAHLAADAAAHDGARVLRVPGTRHGKTHQHATYMIQADATGKGYAYTLSDLADRLGVKETNPSLPDQTRKLALGWYSPWYGRQIKERGTAPNRVKGKISRAAKRAQDMVTLEQHRGGWPKGRRRYRLELFARFLRSAGNAPKDVLKAVQVMAANCNPPYPSDGNDTPLGSVVDSVFTKNSQIISNDKLCKWLEVTPELARKLELLTILPQVVRDERKPPPGGRRGQEKEARRDFIRDHLERYRDASCREVVKALVRAGRPASHQTVNKEMNALGYVHRQRGRPKVAR